MQMKKDEKCSVCILENRDTPQQIEQISSPIQCEERDYNIIQSSCSRVVNVNQSLKDTPERDGGLHINALFTYLAEC